MDDAMEDVDEPKADPANEEPMTPLVQAILDKEPLKVIQGILKQSPELMQQMVKGRFPLSHAVSRGSELKVVKALYRCWPESIRTRDRCGACLPLHCVGNEVLDEEIVEFLIDVYPEGLKVEAREGLPIHCCINRYGQDDAVRVMAERYPDSLLVPDRDGHLPIHLAVFQDLFEMVEDLANRRPGSLVVANNDGCLAIHIAAKVAGTVDGLDILELLANRCPESLVVANNEGCFPIHLAAEQRWLEGVEFLADQRPETVVSTTADGRLPVHLALQSNPRERVGVVQRLAVEAIPEGTRLDLMHSAVRAMHSEDVRALAEAFPTTALTFLRTADSEGSIPIHVAVQETAADRWRLNSDGLKLVRLLVALDPESLLRPNSAGDLPLHIALEHEDTNAMELTNFLFESSPLAALQAGRTGCLPVFAALTKRCFEMVKSIVDLGPQGSHGLCDRGRTPLQVAATLRWRTFPFGHQSICVEALLDAADHLFRTWPESLLIRDADGNLPIHLAIEHLKAESAYEFVCFLIERSTGLQREAGAGGRLPLHVAVSLTDPTSKLVELLVDTWNGALDVRDASGKVPLRLAQANQSVPLDLIYVLVRTRPDLLRSSFS